ncbi:hypothetical protein BJX99DRAFT_265565 [Aspergillus californicus]
MEHDSSSEVSLRLQDLAIAIRSAGDPKFAEMLEKTSHSRTLALFYREKLLSLDLDPETWFKCWQTKNGQKLSDEQITRLVRLTRNWGAQNGDTDKALRAWIANPSAFWGTSSFKTEIEFVQYCLKHAGNSELAPEKTAAYEAETIRSIRPIRRRMSLLILYDIICREVLRLRAQSYQPRPSKYLTSAIKNVVDKACSSQNVSERTKSRTRCTHLQRYGKRWSSLQRRECILAPFENATDNFERISLDDIEIEAINAYEETSHDDEYRTNLRLAFESVYRVIILEIVFLVSENPTWVYPMDVEQLKQEKKIQHTSLRQQVLYIPMMS